MESVYKLSKYSQKIDEACRTNQLNKVMEYNKHELAYINKLSKYFGNQKGGATVELVVAAVQDLVQAVVGDRDRVIGLLQQSVREKSSVIEQIKGVIEGKAFSIGVGEAQTALRPEDVLRKVQTLKQERDELTRKNETLKREKDEVQGSASRGDSIVQRIQAVLNTKEQELTQAQQISKQTTDAMVNLQSELQSAKAELAEATAQADGFKRQLEIVQSNVSAKDNAHATELTKVKEELAKAQQQLEALQAQAP
jgi:chromosome segregation ATPase